MTLDELAARTNTMTLDELARKIKGAVFEADNQEKEARTSALRSLEARKRAGEWLIEAKKEVKHGQWEKWVEAECDLSIQTCQRLMLLAKSWGEVQERLKNLRTEVFGDWKDFLPRKEPRQSEEQEREQEDSEEDGRGRVVLLRKPSEDNQEQEQDQDSQEQDQEQEEQPKKHHKRDRFQTSEDPRRQCWRTPKKIFALLHKIFNFTVDACADKDNALLPAYWTAEQDAREQDWSNQVVYCNPPFADMTTQGWFAKARTAKTCLLIVSVERTVTKPFHEDPPTNILIPNHRWRYEPPPGVDKCDPMDATFACIYGEITEQQVKALKSMGIVVKVCE